MIPEPKIRDNAYFYDLLNVPTTTHLASCVFSDSYKYTLPNATFSIQAVTHSYKYGKELQFVAWSREPPVLERRAKDDSGYYRFEPGYMPLTHVSAEQLRYVADQIDSLIGYSEPIITFTVEPKKVLTEKSKLADIWI